MFDENGNPEEEIISTITIRKLKEEMSQARPININMAINKNALTKNVMFIEENDIVVPGDIIRF